MGKRGRSPNPRQCSIPETEIDPCLMTPTLDTFQRRRLRYIPFQRRRRQKQPESRRSRRHPLLRKPAPPRHDDYHHRRNPSYIPGSNSRQDSNSTPESIRNDKRGRSSWSFMSSSSGFRRSYNHYGAGGSSSRSYCSCNETNRDGWRRLRRSNERHSPNPLPQRWPRRHRSPSPSYHPGSSSRLYSSPEPSHWRQNRYDSGRIYNYRYRPTPLPLDSSSRSRDYERRYRAALAPPKDHQRSHPPQAPVQPDGCTNWWDYSNGSLIVDNYHRGCYHWTPAPPKIPSNLQSCSPDDHSSCSSSPNSHLSSPIYSPGAPRSYTPSLDGHSSPSTSSPSSSRSEDPTSQLVRSLLDRLA